jgi:hypothetical protein
MPLAKDAQFNRDKYISHMTDDELIDCYLSDQMSEREWRQRLADTPGLHEAYDAFTAEALPSSGGPAPEGQTNFDPGPGRPVGRHPALDAPYGVEAYQLDPNYSLSDGTDISRKTVDQIKAAQQRADLKFFERSRKLSPIFPSAVDARERRRDFRETIVAHTLLGLTAAFGIGSLFAEHPGVVVLAACASFAGFLGVCVVAGNRHQQGELFR